MPLKKKGKDCVSDNMRKLLKEKRPYKMAVAIAMNACGKAKKGGKKK